MANHRDRITSVQTLITDLEERVGALQQLTENTDGRFQNIQSRKEEADILKNEIDTIKQQAETSLVDIQSKKESSSQLEGSIEELVENAEESKGVFDTHSANLKEIETKIGDFEKAITEQLSRAASGALALAFSTRQGEVEKELDRWRSILFGTTIALILLTIGFFIYSLFVDINLQFFLKISVAFPLVYAEWFASRQYTKERYILERYAFKAAQAKSLSAFSKTVKEMDETDPGKAEVQKFVIASVNKIYVAPKLDDTDESGLVLENALKIAKDIIKIK